MEEKILEQKQITITVKQATGYIIALISMVFAGAIMYQKMVNSADMVREGLNIVRVDIQTNKAQIEAMKIDINSLRLQIRVLEVKMDDKNK